MTPSKTFAQQQQADRIQLFRDADSVFKKCWRSKVKVIEIEYDYSYSCLDIINMKFLQKDGTEIEDATLFIDCVDEKHLGDLFLAYLPEGWAINEGCEGLFTIELVSENQFAISLEHLNIVRHSIYQEITLC